MRPSCTLSANIASKKCTISRSPELKISAKNIISPRVSTSETWFDQHRGRYPIHTRVSSDIDPTEAHRVLCVRNPGNGHRVLCLLLRELFDTVVRSAVRPIRAGLFARSQH